MANGGTAASSIKPVANTATVPAVPANVDVQEYLTAHRQIPSPDGYRPVANQAPAGVR